ncbi:hypothetical protein [Streptomyces laculatispora]|uniref:hypothetical protein n=1 Tax=Streptomyces laculatispora TaxID=887464 RepID=UPI001A94F370|nr:hypothetical protein [Streptomyces laculatispora]MBO0916879.1 hypothetical protein [Streptomyces laculatispora]
MKSLTLGLLFLTFSGGLISACSSTSPPEGEGSVPRPSKSGIPVSAARPDKLTDPLPGLEFPVEAYLESPGQLREVALAQRSLLVGCLTSEHVAYRPPEPSARPAPALTAGRYGPVNEEQASYGYHFMMAVTAAPAQQSQPRADEQKAVEECSGKAAGRFPSLDDGGVPDRIKAASYKDSMNEPGVRAAFTRWSTCMATAGFTYATPEEAMRDPRWNWQEEQASGTEIRAARQDVACKKKTGLVTKWFGAETEIQKEAVKAEGAKLREVRARISERAETAREVLTS